MFVSHLLAALPHSFFLTAKTKKIRRAAVAVFAFTSSSSSSLFFFFLFLSQTFVGQPLLSCSGSLFSCLRLIFFSFTFGYLLCSSSSLVAAVSLQSVAIFSLYKNALLFQFGTRRVSPSLESADLESGTLSIPFFLVFFFLGRMPCESDSRSMLESNLCVPRTNTWLQLCPRQCIDGTFEE